MTHKHKVEKLRQNDRKIADKELLEDGFKLSEEEAHKLIYELKEYQAELELQNEELKLSRSTIKNAANKYIELYEFAPISYFTLSREGIILELNNCASKLVGKERSVLDNCPFTTLISADTVPIFNLFLTKVFNSKAKECCEVSLKTNGNDFPVHIHMDGIVTITAEQCLLSAVDITERKIIADTQKFLIECGLPGSGENFFESLARYLAQSLRMEYICIDRLEGDGLTAQTLAIFNDGKFDTNVSYTLKETPCGDVVGKSVCCFPENVCRLFPNDIVLQDLKAESYIGSTLWNFQGKPTGLIAVIGRKPLKNPALAEAMLKLVSTRAAGELERTQVENKLNRLNAELEFRVKERTIQLLKTNVALRKTKEKYRTVADFTYDWEYWISPEGKIIYMSPSVERVTGYTLSEFKSNPQLLNQIVFTDDRGLWERHRVESHQPDSGENYHEIEFRIVSKTGGIHWMGHVCKRIFVAENYLGLRVSNRDITDRVKAENDLLKNTVEVEERERNRFSLELHDGLGPLLSTIKLYFQWLAETNDAEKVKLITENGNKNINLAIKATRDMAQGLSSLFLIDSGYVSAVENFIQSMNIKNKFTINFTFNSTSRFSNFMEITLYRITIELINNTLKHAMATQIDIAFNYNEKRRITLIYSDNGVGFDSDNAVKNSKGFGLKSVQQRIQILKGIMRIESCYKQGMEVYIEIPVI